MQHEVNITIVKTLTCHIDANSPGEAVLIAERELLDNRDEAVWKEVTHITCKHDDHIVNLERVN